MSAIGRNMWRSMNDQPLIDLPDGQSKPYWAITIAEAVSLAERHRQHGTEPEADRWAQHADRLIGDIEYWCRSTARLCGVKVKKSRRRNAANVTSLYSVIDPDTNAVVRGDMTLQQMEAFLGDLEKKWIKSSMTTPMRRARTAL